MPKIVYAKAMITRVRDTTRDMATAHSHYRSVSNEHSLTKA